MKCCNFDQKKGFRVFRPTVKIPEDMLYNCFLILMRDQTEKTKTFRSKLINVKDIREFQTVEYHLTCQVNQSREIVHKYSCKTECQIFYCVLETVLTS